MSGQWDRKERTMDEEDYVVHRLERRRLLTSDRVAALLLGAALGALASLFAAAALGWIHP